MSPEVRRCARSAARATAALLRDRAATDQAEIVRRRCGRRMPKPAGHPQPHRTHAGGPRPMPHRGRRRRHRVLATPAERHEHQQPRLSPLPRGIADRSHPGRLSTLSPASSEHPPTAGSGPDGTETDRRVARGRRVLLNLLVPTYVPHDMTAGGPGAGRRPWLLRGCARCGARIVCLVSFGWSASAAPLRGGCGQRRRSIKMTRTMITITTMVPMPMYIGVPLGGAPASRDGAASALLAACWGGGCRRPSPGRAGRVPGKPSATS
jgi:hypothetical protein